MAAKIAGLFFASFMIWINMVASVDRPKFETGQTYTVAAVLEHPFLMKNDSHPKGYSGYVMDFIKKLEDFKSGVQYVIRVVEQHGLKQLGGHWNGIIGDVKSRAADIGIGPVSITNERSAAVDFSNPFMKSKTTMVAYKTASHSIDAAYRKPFQFPTRPFHPYVWVTICISYVLISVLAGILERVTQGDRSPIPRCIGHGFWWATLAFTFQGFVKAPRSIAVRVLIAFWAIMSILNICLYVSGMVSLMGSELKLDRLSTAKYYRFENHIKSLQDLEKQSHVRYSWVEGSNTHALFKNGLPDDVYGKMFQVKDDEDQSTAYLKTVEEGIQKVRDGKGNFIFIGETVPSSYFTQQKPCDLEFIGDDKKNLDYAVVIRKDTDYKELIDNMIDFYTNNKALENMKKKWFPDECKDDDETIVIKQEDDIVNRNVLHIAEYCGIVLVLLIGVILAVVVSIVECVLRRKRNKADDADAVGM